MTATTLITEQLDTCTYIMGVTTDLLLARNKLRQITEERSLNRNPADYTYHNKRMIDQRVIVMQLEAKFAEATE